jgi:hypothetical protein
MQLRSDKRLAFRANGFRLRAKRTKHFPIKRLLHTDILEQKYGSIKAKVLKHDSRVREAHLVDGKGISRTYALTFFPKRGVPSSLRVIDTAIRGGKPIGKTFREYGYEVRKNVIDVIVLPVPNWLQREFQMPQGLAKARLSEFVAKRNGESPLVYGTVLEVYNPDFRVGEINEADLKQINAPLESLKKQGVDGNELWRIIGTENIWGAKRKKLDAAKAKSTKELGNLRKKIERRMNARH